MSTGQILVSRSDRGTHDLPRAAARPGSTTRTEAPCRSERAGRRHPHFSPCGTFSSTGSDPWRRHWRRQSTETAPGAASSNWRASRGWPGRRTHVPRLLRQLGQAATSSSTSSGRVRPRSTSTRRDRSSSDWRPGHRLAILIAVGIGCTTLPRGSQSARRAPQGEISLALALIIGFGLHNATEGFAVIGPMSAENERPSWAFLALLGLIGGGPTFLGTVVGEAWVSEAVSVAFLALAAGSILYVPSAALQRHPQARLPGPGRLDAAARPPPRLRHGLHPRGGRDRKLRTGLGPPGGSPGRRGYTDSRSTSRARALLASYTRCSGRSPGTCSTLPSAPSGRRTWRTRPRPRTR